MASPPLTNPAQWDNTETATQAYYDHSTAKRVNTDAAIFDTIRRNHPDSHVTIVPEFSCPLSTYSQVVSHITLTPVSPESKLSWLIYLPPARRLDFDTGALVTEPFYEIFTLHYSHQEYLVYFIDGRDGTQPYGVTRNFYIVSPHPRTDGGLATRILSQLIREAGAWQSQLHQEIWVFDQGYWQKDASLYANIMHARWSNVILHDDLKNDLIDTVTRFFDAREQYDRLGVPWKRGLIFYGPPGNGKTISIKATMHTLYSRPQPVPTLYVKSLRSFAGPEYSVSQIFERARAEAPCYLVFEDLDSMVTDDVRSFFLNAVDGLSLNEGVLMVGSTNHLERLDPGIAKRPSRFDRKMFFGDPDRALRERYAAFWRGKVLGSGKEKEDGGEESDYHGKLPVDDSVEFPEVLCGEIAAITGGFSFAYMQEAFLASLLAIANRRQAGLGGECEFDEEEADDSLGSLGEQWEMLGLDGRVIDAGRGATSGNEKNMKKEKGGHGHDGDGKKDELDKYELWVEMKKQVANLRREMGRDKERE